MRTVEVAPYRGPVKKERGSIANIKKRKRRRKALMGEATCASDNRGCRLREEVYHPVYYGEISPLELN
jgi:hypothetical protein